MASSMRPITLDSPQSRALAVQMVHDAPEGMVMWIAEPTRSLPQNAKFHATCGDVAKVAEYMGKKRTGHQWKVLFISGHAIATGLGADVVPGLEGEFCNIRESSATMGIRRMNSVIEYQEAWIATHGIRLPSWREE